MTVSYDVGFIIVPRLSDLDLFMEKLGFSVEAHAGLFDRIYTSQDIELWFTPRVDDELRALFGQPITAYAELKQFGVQPTYTNVEERLQIIQKQEVRTELDWNTHVTPESLSFYQVALALRDQYNARVISTQTGEEINPNLTLMKGC